MSEAELIERAGRGDPRAIRELHDRHASLVLTVARRITGDMDQARDCAQEVWIRALRSLSTYEARAPFAAWIRRIAARVALQSDRADRRRSLREGIFSGTFDDTIEPAPLLLDGPRLEAAVLRLPNGMRKILVLHDVEGFTHEEIGEALGIAPGTSKSQLFKARGKMREMMRRAEVTERDQIADPRQVRGMDRGGAGDGEKVRTEKLGGAATQRSEGLEQRTAASWKRGGTEKWST
jgi:RNA polymerase sigma-70 factor (ECF subfamily)